MLTRKLEALPDPSAFLISFSLRFFVIGAGYTVNGIWGGSRISSLSTQALAFWSFWNLGHANVAEGSAKSLDLSGQHTSADPSLFWNSTTYPATHTDPKKRKNPSHTSVSSWLLFLLVHVSLAFRLVYNNLATGAQRLAFFLPLFRKRDLD
jgi:hypothetical protein